MNHPFRHLTLQAILAFTLIFPPLRAAELPLVAPAQAGLSAAKLARIDTTVNRLVEERKLAGATVMICRHGQVAYFKAFGHMDLENQKPMGKDTIFRIYSMTKAITSAAALMLWEEGKFDLDDPLSKHLPEFKDLKKWTPEGEKPVERPPTIRDLLRHTAGLTYGFFGNSPVDKLYRQANLLDPGHDLEAFSEKLARLPLLYEPGTAWEYSVATDVLGRLIEVASGMSFEAFLQKRLLDPLDMRDTGFHVPAAKAERFATTYNSNGEGQLTVSDAPATSRFLKPPALASGGGGLVSTTRDYMRFLCLIANGGELQGRRLLKKETVALMTKNQLPPAAMPIQLGGGKRPGVGFGLGFSVRVRDSDWDPRGRVGEYGWGGMASTHYWASPKDGLVVVIMQQTLPYSFLLEWALKGPIYEALEE